MKKKIIAVLLCLISLLISILIGQDISGDLNEILQVTESQWEQVFDTHEEEKSLSIE
ncbi:MAG: hypothetical protein GVY07_07205 [Bacteroidetes bacterium]|jgi:hypothetical protein|nr:hypothetical protein [Bacteroidota bacterium]